MHRLQKMRGLLARVTDPDERVIAYRTCLLAETTFVRRVSGIPDSELGRAILNDMILECFAMQARIVMEVLGVKRGPRPKRDVLAKEKWTDWKPPTDPTMTDWMDMCDRGAAHPTKGPKPVWARAPEMARKIVSELRDRLPEDRSSEVLRELVKTAYESVHGEPAV